MPEQFLHGVEVVEIDNGARPIRTVKSSVIGLVGTAPNAEAAIAATLLTGSVAANTGLTFTAATAGVAGNAVGVRFIDPKANSSALAITVSGNIVTVSLATDNTGAITTTASALVTAWALVSGATALATVAATSGSSGAGVVSPQNTQYLSGGLAAAFPLNTPTLIAGSQRDARRLGTTGTLPAALAQIFAQTGAVVVVVRVSDSVTPSTETANVVGGIDASTGAYSGIYGFLASESVAGVVPRILIAPGQSQNASVRGALVTVATRLRAVAIADGPNTNDSAAITDASSSGSDRLYLHDPEYLWTDSTGTQQTVPASPFIAGLIARVDNSEGFWVSPSNHEIFGIDGTARPVDFALGDANSRANILNENNVATTIRQNGFRLWGNRTLSADSKFAFLCVRRTADLINDSILRAHLWAVDKGITKNYLKSVTEGVRGYLRSLKAQGAILGGDCYPDPDLNTAANITQGKVYFDIKFTPTYPAEHVTFRSFIVDDYIQELTK